MRLSHLVSVSVGLFLWGSATWASAEDRNPETDKGSIAALTAQEPVVDDDASQGLLLRELGRQAVLIAARDGLGLPTRDQSIREPMPAGQTPIEPQTWARAGKTYQLKLTSAGKEIFSTEVPFGSLKRGDEPPGYGVLGNYFDVARELESLSRGPLIDALKQTGLKQRVGLKADGAPVPPTIEPLLEEMTLITQFDAVRRAHGAIRLHGETDELLGDLVRGYANLGEMSAADWTTSAKVFQARSILYAQRMMARNPKSAAARWHNAYAWAMTGFHGHALEEVENAIALGKATNESAPPWAELIRPLCRFDTSALLDLAAADRRRAPLATYMAFLTVEQTDSQSLVIEMEKAALKLNPRCLRLVDAVATKAGVSYAHQFTQFTFVILADQMFNTLHDVPGLPANVARLMPAGPQQLLDPATTAAVEKALMSDADHDTAEPSAAALGRLLQDASFLCVYRRAFFMAYMWNVDRTDFLNAVDPLIVDHPYAAFLRSMRLDPQTEGDQIRSMTAAMKVVDSEPRMYEMFRWCGRQREPSPIPNEFNDDLMMSHADWIARDIWTKYVDFGRPLGIAKELRQVSPYSPQASMGIIENDWDSVAKTLPQFEKEFGYHPDVQAALARQYLSRGDANAAADHLEKYLAKASDGWAFGALADIQLARGDEAGWLATLKKDLAQEDYGLEHAAVRVKIAQHYMDKGEYTAAEPYAEEAAQSWAAWAIEAAVHCYEGEGKWDKAEQWLQNEVERYGHPFDLYFWCKRTGHGNLAAAEKMADDFVAAHPGAGNAEDVGLYYLCKDKPREALKSFEEQVRQVRNPRAALAAAVLLDAANDTAGRDQMLSIAAAYRINPNNTNRAWLQSQIDFARQASAALGEGIDAKTPADRIAKIVTIARTGDDRYFLARILIDHGQPAAARELLLQSHARPGTSLYSSLLAEQELAKIPAR